MRRPAIAAVGLAALAAAVIAGCGGGGGSSPAPKPVSGSNGTTAQIGSGVSGTLSLTVANGTTVAATKRKPAFVSPGALSAGVSINGGAVTFADVSSSSSLCTTSAGGARTCTINVGAPAGSDTFTVSLYSGASGGGSMLSSGTGSTTVTAGTSFTVPIALNAVVASLSNITAGNTNFTVGVPQTSPTFTPVFVDPAGQAITGTAPYLHPIALTFNSPHVTASPSSLTAPGQPLAFSYDGSAAAPSSITATATSNGVTVFTGTVPVPGLFAVRCNLGATPGQATVNPYAITIGPDGNLWWTELATNEIGTMNPATGCSSIHEYPNVAGGTAFGIASGGDGNIWYSTESNELVRMSTTGTLVGSVGLGSAALVSAYALAEDSNGNVWYINGKAGNNQVAYVDHGSLTAQTFGSPPTANGLNSTSSIALGPDNAIWFTEPYTSPQSRVGRISTPANTGSAGTYTESPLSGSNGSTIFPFSFSLAAGPISNGNLWVSLYGSNANNQFFAYFMPSAATVSSFSEFPNAIDPNSFANLVNMFLGGDGNMWIAEGGGAVKIPVSSPNNPAIGLFTDNGQSTFYDCVAASNGNNYCTTQGSLPLGAGYITTYDAIVGFTPR